MTRQQEAQRLAADMIKAGMQPGRAELYEEALAEMVKGLMNATRKNEWKIWVKVTREITRHFRSRLKKGEKIPADLTGD